MQNFKIHQNRTVWITTSGGGLSQALQNRGHRQTQGNDANDSPTHATVDRDVKKFLKRPNVLRDCTMDVF